VELWKISLKDLKQWLEANVKQVQVQKRRAFLAEIGGPDPGKAHPAQNHCRSTAYF
jgi:hypothetical protein